MSRKAQVPTLDDGQALSIGKQLVTVDRFLRWGPILEDYRMEIYRVRARSSRQGDSQFNFWTLRKIPLTSEGLLHAAVQELEILKAVHRFGKHPHIVTLVDSAFFPSASVSGRYDVYYLFEEEEIGTLTEALNLLRTGNGMISEIKLLKLLRPVCEAVAFLHTFRPPLLHRDIRFRSIILTSNHMLKLSSFLSVAFGFVAGSMDDEDKLAIIEDFACYTELRYRAPEVLFPTSKVAITTKSDVWSIGVLLFNSAFGTLPFSRKKPMDIFDGEYSFPHLEYPHIMALIDTLLQRSPDDRPDILDVVRTIYSISEGSSPALSHLENPTRNLYALLEGIASDLRMPRRSYMRHAPRKSQNMSIPKAPLIRFLPLPSTWQGYTPEGFLNAPVATFLPFSSREDEYTPRAPIIPLKELYKPDKEDLEEGTPRRLAGALMGKTLAIDPSVSDGEPRGAMDRYDWNALKDSINKLEGVATNTDSLGLQNVPKNVAGLNSGNAVPSSERSLSPNEDFVTTSLRLITHVQPGVEVPAQVIRRNDGRRGNPGYRRGSGLTNVGQTNVGQEPNRVWSSAAPFRTRRPPSPPRQDPTNALKSERIPLTKEGYFVLEEHPKSPKSAGSKAESALPELKPEAATGTLGLSSEPPLQDRPGTSDNNIQDSKVAPEHPTDGPGQENQDWGRDNQQLSDRPSESPPDAVDDVGSFITSISQDAVSINGHFCDVFEGMHSTAGRVALKRPRIGGTGDDEGTIRRFEREAITWRRLRHPRILEFLGTFRRNRHIYLVSPFINNGTLVEYIARHPEINRIRLLCETADALNYLHQNDVVHGDIKGSNILIDDNIHCLLCDFGLTRMTHSRTSTAMRGVGTFRWQSPELWFDAPKSFSSDVYAYAMTIVEVLTGDAPFASFTNDTAVMFAVVGNDERPQKAPLKSLSGISYQGAWDVAEACWSKKPEERISMSVALQRLQADPSSS